MSSDAAPDLVHLCSELAADLDELSTTTEGETVAYARGGVVFARVAGGRLDVRLPAEIARAALRTPDTAPDPDDRGWVRFAPGGAEQDEVDRAAAWFHTAWRHALDH